MAAAMVEMAAAKTSDFESAGPAGPVGKLSPFDHVGGLSLIVPVGEMSSVDPARRPPAGAGSSGLDGISGQKGSCYYTIACRSACRG